MAAERKRPWYLVFALLGAMALGTSGACSGWETVTQYRGSIDPLVAQGVPDAADRAAIETRVDAYVRALDAAKSRGWPLAVAALLLGGATMLFSMRALGGSSGARAALIQVVVAQAGLNGLSYWLMRDVTEAKLRYVDAFQAAENHAQVPDRLQADDRSRAMASMLRVASPIVLALSTLGSALVVVALTRRRARDFFDASAAAIQER
jgi:hypothetical protein